MKAYNQYVLVLRKDEAVQSVNGLQIVHNIQAKKNIARSKQTGTRMGLADGPAPAVVGLDTIPIPNGQGNDQFLHDEEQDK